MSDKKLGATEGALGENEQNERREFLKKAGKVALTVPAAALLLSAESMPAQAQTAPSGNQNSTIVLGNGSITLSKPA
jgi:formiminotetrahydrofolate cyclodeaminase